MYLSGYAVGGQAQYAAIWEQSTGPVWLARNGLTADQYQTEFNTQAAAGYRLVFVNGYTVNGVDYYAALWDKAPAGPWQAKHGLSAADYQTYFNAHGRRRAIAFATSAATARRATSTSRRSGRKPPGGA